MTATSGSRRSRRFEAGVALAGRPVPSKDYAFFVVPGWISTVITSLRFARAKASVIVSLREAASSGYPILGICNGFQILCEEASSGRAGSKRHSAV